MTQLVRRDRRLTSAEKEFARRFRDAAQAMLTKRVEDEKPEFTPPSFLGHFRHNCGARSHADSTAIELKEVYVSSADPVGEWAGHVHHSLIFDEAFPEHENTLGEREGLPLFGFVFKEGHCRRCKVKCLSKAGVLVLQSVRPPLASRMARE